MSCIYGCTYFQFTSVTACDPNTHIVRGESFSGFRALTVWRLSCVGLTDSSNGSGSGVSLFFRDVSEINFLISNRIITNLRDLL